MKYDDFLATLKNKVKPVPVFIPLTIKYLLENGPTATTVLQRHYDDFLKQNDLPDPGDVLESPTEDMTDLGMINESIFDSDWKTLSLTLEDPDEDSLFKDVEDFDGKGLLVVVCQEKIDTYTTLARLGKGDWMKDWMQFKGERIAGQFKDTPSGTDFVATKDDRKYSFDAKFRKGDASKALKEWLSGKFRQDEEIVASSEQASRKKISEEYGLAFDPYGGDDPEGWKPNMKIFRMMDILIHSLRRFVQAVLRDEKDQDGKPWHTSDRYVPQSVLDRANQLVRESSQAKTTAKSGVELFLMCMDEGGLFEVVQKNWKKFFKNAFGNEQAILNHIGELKAIRDPNFHFRDLPADEQRRVVKRLEVYVVDILSYTELYAGR